MEALLERIKKSNRILLTTHMQCDGDGLGSEMAFFFALKKVGKFVKMINLDQTPKKYRFLEPDKWIQYFDLDPNILEDYDLAIAFDTNDQRMIEPLAKVLMTKKVLLTYLDHHPILKQGPFPSRESWIDTNAASTGEMTYRLIKALNIELDPTIATCLYTSITFDTQLYRYVRNSPLSHRIAAELIEQNIRPEQIHRYLFGNQTVNKMAFLAKALGQIEYFSNGQLALLKIKDTDLFHYNLEPDESRDVVDMIMNIESLEAAVLFREDSSDEYKVSFRSKGKIQVLDLAESLNGGGHIYSAGAFLKGEFSEFKKKIVKDLTEKLKKISIANT